VGNVRYGYTLRVEIGGDERGTLRDALEDEPFGIRDRLTLGTSALEAMIDDGEIVFEQTLDAPFPEFERDIGTLSVYLSQYIIGREIWIEPTPGAPVLKGWKVVGRMGETARLALDLDWDPRAQEVVDHDEDLRDARAQWDKLPEWLRTALRAKHPELRGC
jgi:hypothetical protein